MSDIPAAIRHSVMARADGHCEYCRLAQIRQEATFHVDHIVPRAADGPTTPENLALACVSCSLRKAARQSAIDPETDAVVPLFNPRLQSWPEHFILRGNELIGLTATGRATVAALLMNRPLMLAIRKEECARGWRP